MKSLFLLAVLMLAVACGSTDKSDDDARPTESWTPRMGRTTQIWQVLDRDTKARVGFVERKKYDDGRVIYWVKGADRRENQGFILGTGRAYKYLWTAGRRGPDPEDLGADVRSVGARRILGHGRPVVLEKTDIQTLIQEYDIPLEDHDQKGGGGDDE